MDAVQIRYTSPEKDFVTWYSPEFGNDVKIKVDGADEELVFDPFGSYRAMEAGIVIITKLTDMVNNADPEIRWRAIEPLHSLVLANIETSSATALLRRLDSDISDSIKEDAGAALDGLGIARADNQNPRISPQGPTHGLASPLQPQATPPPSGVTPAGAFKFVKGSLANLQWATTIIEDAGSVTIHAPTRGTITAQLGSVVRLPLDVEFNLGFYRRNLHGILLQQSREVYDPVVEVWFDGALIKKESFGGATSKAQHQLGPTLVDALVAAKWACNQANESTLKVVAYYDYSYDVTVVSGNRGHQIKRLTFKFNTKTVPVTLHVDNSFYMIPGSFLMTPDRHDHHAWENSQFELTLLQKPSNSGNAGLPGWERESLVSGQQSWQYAGNFLATGGDAFGHHALSTAIAESGTWQNPRTEVAEPSPHVPSSGHHASGNPHPPWTGGEHYEASVTVSGTRSPSGETVPWSGDVMESSDSGVTCKLLTTVTVFDIDPGFDDSGDGSDEEEPQEQF